MTDRARIKAYGILAAVFLVGGVAGAAGAYAYAERRMADLAAPDRQEMREHRRFRALSRELDLSDEQEEKVRAIMREHAAARDRAMRQMLERCGDAVRAEKERIDSAIREVLTPEQQKRFDELSEKHRQRFWFGPKKRGYH